MIVRSVRAPEPIGVTHEWAQPCEMCGRRAEASTVPALLLDDAVDRLEQIGPEIFDVFHSDA